MEYPLAVIALGLLVALVVARPLRGAEAEERREDERRAELEARRRATYREIRDTELDFRTGKLAPEDYRRVDRELRTNAIATLRELDELAPEGAARGTR